MPLSKSEHDQELAIVDVQLNLLRRREAEFQKIIEEMQTLIVSCQHEREELEAQREELVKMRIPIYQLPPELLIRISQVHIQSEFEDQSIMAHVPRFWAPLRLSHVCRSWYKLITSTPELWSYISYHDILLRPPPLQEWFRRSNNSPLYILYRVPSDISNADDLFRIKKLSADLKTYFSRIRTFDFQTHTVRAMEFCLDSLKGLISAADTPLDTLALSLLSETSIDHGMGSLYYKGTTHLSPAHTLEITCRLKSLKCDHFIPFCLPPQTFAGLTRLELSFTPRKPAQSTPKLLMSALCNFLYHTPRLEELIIFGTVPLFDMISAESRVPLVYLRALDWSNPQSRDATKFLSFLHTPSLAKLDLWLGEHPQWTVSPAVEYPLVREINLQCMGDNSVKNVFGKLLFPILERMEISNFESNPPTSDNKRLPSLPPLTDIFRDPRLSNLTHLTLSSWRIPSDIGFARALLGYTPVLTSLTLERCLNVGILAQSLQEHVLVQLITKATPQQRCDVRVCPNLEALTFWGCNDMELACLRELVLARNKCSEPSPYAIQSPNINPAPDDACSAPQTGAAPKKGDKEAESSTQGRVILPLRRSRRQGQALPSSRRLGSAQGASSALPNVISGANVIEKTSQHARILYLRIQDCKLINQAGAESLKALGILDVIWS